MVDMVTFNGVPLATYGMPALMILVLTMLTFNETDSKSAIENVGSAVLAPPAFLAPSPAPFAAAVPAPISTPVAQPVEEEEEEEEEPEEEINGGRKRKTRRRRTRSKKF
jgi:hypothetical protein